MDEKQSNSQPDTWAIVELMGHITLAGRLTKPSALWQLDIPEGDTYRTELFGDGSVYRIRMVSEQIARAYAPYHEMIEYNAPIVTREQYETAVELANRKNSILQRQVEELSRRLTAVNNLPELPKPEDQDDNDYWEE